MLPSNNQRGLSNKKDGDTDESSWEDDYDQHYLSNLPFVYHEVKCKSESKPRPRSGHRIITDSHGNIYCLGGYNPEGLQRDDSPNALFKELWKFNMSSLKWTKIKMNGSPPQLLCSFAALCIDDLLFVQGGTGVPFGRNGSNRLYVCQLSTGFWKKYRLKADNDDIPPKQYGQALAFDPDELILYSVGGTCGHSYNLGVTRINLRDNTAELLYPYNNFDGPGSYRHEIALHNNRIYLFGGGTSTYNIGFEELFYFDLSSKLWKTIKTFPDSTHGHPTARKFHGLVTLDEQIYMIGGASHLPNGLVALDDLWRFNLNSLEWTFITKIPKPVYFHSATLSSSGLMTVFGGVEASTTGRSLRTQRTDALYTMWLKVPSLGEMAWIAFLNNFPDVTKIPSSRLLEIGVPPSYIARLND
uniref:Kelch domain-containing protein 10 n=2 Tax=Tetranychus urticae TaxID=32264 RepID=T1KS51_TETUR